MKSPLPEGLRELFQQAASRGAVPWQALLRPGDWVLLVISAALVAVSFPLLWRGGVADHHHPQARLAEGARGGALHVGGGERGREEPPVQAIEGILAGPGARADLQAPPRLAAPVQGDEQGRAPFFAQPVGYDGRTFFRVIEGFMDQTGDPLETGEGQSSLPNLDPEFSFRRGADQAASVVEDVNSSEVSGSGMASTLSMRLLSMSTISKRQPPQSMRSPVEGTRPSSSIVMPLRV